MAVNEITKSVSVKLNLGNYQSLDFFVSMKSTDIDSEHPEDIALAANTLRALCNETMLKDLRAHFKARRKPMSDKEICRQFGLTIEDEFG